MTQIKVGDKVRVLPGANVLAADGSGNTQVGDILTVEKIWEGVPYPIYTDADNGVCWREAHLEVVE